MPLISDGDFIIKANRLGYLLLDELFKGTNSIDRLIKQLSEQKEHQD